MGSEMCIRDSACYSTEASEFEYCENLVKQGMPSIEAIEATAQHFYGQEIEDYQHALQQQTQGITHET